MIFNTLFTYNEDTTEYDPLLAKRWTYVDLNNNPLTDDGTFEGHVAYDKASEYYSSIDDDYMMIRIELFDNIKWSDGEKLTVEDVYYTFDLATDYSYSNHAGALVWTNDLQHKSENGVLKKRGMFTYEHMDDSGIFYIPEEEKDTVMYLKTNKVVGAIATLFSTILVLPKHVYEGEVDQNHPLNNKTSEGVIKKQAEDPISCGGYLLKKDETNNQIITLIRNKNYHLNRPDSDYYKADKIKFLLYLDSNTAIYALKKGYIDVLNSSISSNYSSLFDKDEDVEIIRAKSTGTSALVLNVNPKSKNDSEMKSLFQDISFRKALSYSINQEELIRYVLNGIGEEASAGLFMKSSPLYNADADIIDRLSYEKRLKQANEILDERFSAKDSSGYRLYRGKRIKFEIVSNKGYQDTVNYLQNQFEKIGIDVQYKAGGSSAENTYLYSGNFDMTIQNVLLSYSNADTMLKSHFVALEHSSNYGRLENGELNGLIEAMRDELNQNRKKELIGKIQVLIAESYYKIPLYSSDVLSLVRTDRFTNYQTVDGCTGFNDKTLRNLVKQST